MPNPLRLLLSLLGRWTREQDTALRQLTRRRRWAQRLRGFTRSERVDAKFLLLAIAGVLPVILSDELGWPRGPLWHVMFWLGVVWAVFVVGYASVGYFRAIRRSLQRKS